MLEQHDLESNLLKYFTQIFVDNIFNVNLITPDFQLILNGRHKSHNKSIKKVINLRPLKNVIAKDFFVKRLNILI